jgi:hypothetical protein
MGPSMSKPNRLIHTMFWISEALNSERSINSQSCYFIKYKTSMMINFLGTKSGNTTSRKTSLLFHRAIVIAKHKHKSCVLLFVYAPVRHSGDFKRLETLFHSRPTGSEASVLIS